MDLMNVVEQMETIIGQVDTITKQYSDSKTKYENLDGQTKTTLAFYSMMFEGSEAKIQRQALACEEYKKHLEAVALARKEYNRCWSLLEGLRIKSDLLRSLNKHIENV